MAFKTRSTNTGSGEGNREVDYKAMNTETVELAQLKQPETLVGVLSGVVDAGIQPQPDAQYEFTGTAEEEKEEIEKDSTVYFKDAVDYNDNKKVKRFKFRPVKATQSVVFTIDFPDIVLDKGKYFGESDPRPLRLVLGNEFTPAGGKTIAAKPIPLNIRKNDKTNNKWSLPFNNTIYKMAVAAKLIEQGEPFLPERIDELLGKAFQFKVQVFFNAEGYYTERCSYAASLSRGQKEPEFNKDWLYMIQFDDDNKAADLKQLRASLKNTIRNALDFDTSKIKDQIGSDNKGGGKTVTPQDETVLPTPTVAPTVADTSVDTDDYSPFDDDVAF